MAILKDSAKKVKAAPLANGISGGRALSILTRGKSVFPGNRKRRGRIAGRSWILENKMSIAFKIEKIRGKRKKMLPFFFPAILKEFLKNCNVLFFYGFFDFSS